MSTNCSDDIPPTEIYYKDIKAVEIVFMALGGVFTLLSIMIFLEEVIYLNGNYACNQRRNKTLWLLGTFPVYTVTCSIGTLIPTSALFCDMAASAYMAVSLYQFLSLMFLYYGGKGKMMEYCQIHDKQIALRSPPCACCCFCLPQLQVTGKNLNVIKWFVLQASFVQPILKFIMAVLWADDKLDVGETSPTKPNMYLTLMGSVSTLMAMYGIAIIYRVSCDTLQHQKLKPKFLMFPLTMITSNFQSFLFGLFARVGWIECVGIRSARLRASNLHHSSLLIEMFLLALLMRYAYRRPDKEESRNFCLTESPSENVTIVSTSPPRKYGEDNEAFSKIDGSL